MRVLRSRTVQVRLAGLALCAFIVVSLAGVLAGSFTGHAVAQPPGDAAVQPPEGDLAMAGLLTTPLETPPGADELTKLLYERRNAAAAELEALHAAYDAGRQDLPRMLEAARRLTGSELELRRTPAERVAVLEQFVKFAQFVEQAELARHEVGISLRADLENARFLRADAQIQLLRAKKQAGVKN